MDIKWEDPPPVTRGPGAARPDEIELAEVLRKNPDRWVRLRDFTPEQTNRAGNLANVIRQGRRAAFRQTEQDHGVWEAAARRVPDTNITAVYIRYATLNND